ncbi:MAG: glycosyltransferase family 4 protein [Candidatus Aenigmatarchaeota archaeon]
MKILLRKGHHSVYDDLVKYPPEGVEYILPNFVTESKSRSTDKIKKKIFTTYVKVLKRPHEIFVNPQGSDLIHACSGIMIKNNYPWVIDTEHVSSFVGFEAGRLEKVRPHVEKLLRSDYCRKVMTWSDAGKQSIINGLDTRGFKDKIETVYPAMKPLDFKKKKHGDTNLLFVSVRFYTKGGKELLEAYDKLKKKHDFKLTIVSHVPKEVRDKYKKDKNIIFHEPTIPRKTLLEKFYSVADVFVLPSYMDTFGMVFLEAMSYKIPILAANTFAIPEIIKNAGLMVDVSDFSWYGKNYLFAWDSWEKFSKYAEYEDKPKIVKDMVNKLSKLIEDKQLRTKMGSAGRREVETGRFSIKERNKKLKRIYEDAIK